MLTGQELLAKVKELNHLPKSELVRECGYVIGDRVCFTQFYDALLQAKGLNVGKSLKAGRPGRNLSFRTKVQFNGKLSVGEGYVKAMGFKPGDEFEIKLGRNSVTLTAV